MKKDRLVFSSLLRGYVVHGSGEGMATVAARFMMVNTHTHVVECVNTLAKGNEYIKNSW